MITFYADHKTDEEISKRLFGPPRFLTQLLDTTHCDSSNVSIRPSSTSHRSNELVCAPTKPGSRWRKQESSWEVRHVRNRCVGYGCRRPAVVLLLSMACAKGEGSGRIHLPRPPLKNTASIARIKWPATRPVAADQIA